MDEKKLDMVFIHPPAILGESKSILDADVAYTHQFVAIPVGLFNMAHNLDVNGFSVKIVNLGERTLKKKHEETLEDLVKNILAEFSPKVIGIDIHWWVHSAGAVECARLVKQLCPDTFIFVGGITASFFAEEILKEYDCIDFVMTGECDDTIVDLVRELTGNKPDIRNIFNLVYRNNDKIVRNQVSIPDITDSLELTRYDLLAEPPSINRDRALIPITRGCTQKCCYCGASKKSFQSIMHRVGMGLISPSTLVGLIKKNKNNGKDKIYIYGDIRMGGNEYVESFFELLGESGISGIHIVIEFFELPTIDYIKKWTEWSKHTGNTVEATLSPDSGNEKIRKLIGRNYSNEGILDAYKTVIESGMPFSIYFMLGLPNETNDTIEDSLKLAEKIVEMYADKFNRKSVRHEIIGYEFMQIPDVGSPVYLNPGEYGFHLNFNGLRSLREIMMSARHWGELIGFSTDCFTTDELVHKYYYIKERVCNLYFKYGLISEKDFKGRLLVLKNDRKAYERIKSNLEVLDEQAIKDEIAACGTGGLE